MFKERAKETRLVVTLGATLLVDDNVWAKPQVSASVLFDGAPDDKVLAEAWDWLWTKQVVPQSEDLLAVIQRRILTEGRTTG